ncbi:hypothetical protein P153DRAFT_395431 [Dothidotthia symphoricarpi CBS 119687]|uniref:BTB domain-containing protein n=1 Tax=Dothidotthia symphoricarpi CBS 119687 TaxID=1392245 RepID=A0A6A6AGJ5_9PLEO|nr:uncharacterized protein P153DRAFT_395431 [Dothidotthia symphoricarpi CBS 119687]KAF2131039.1 hypothetical protein P153DRAFT_395431 [Dothidotthia symphoricarpi CBS 119687]
MGFSFFHSFVMLPTSHSVPVARNGSSGRHNVQPNEQQRLLDTRHSAGNHKNLQRGNSSVPQRYQKTHTSFRRSLLSGVDINSGGLDQPNDQTGHQQQTPANQLPIDDNHNSQPSSLQTKDFFVETFTSARDYIELIVGPTNDVHKFVVSKAHLRQLSQVWDAFVMSRRWCTRREYVVRKFSKRKRVLRLSEEDPRIIRLIMYIAHHQFSKLPKKLDFKDVVRLVDVAQRYNTMHLLQHHLNGWLEPYFDRLYDPGYEEWLHIGQHVSHASRAYIQLAQHLKLHCWTSNTGELLVPGSESPIIGLLPPKALYHIKADRTKLLTSIVTSAYTLLSNMINTTPCEVAIPNACLQCQECCAGTNYFRLTLHLKQLGLFPRIENVSQIRHSVFEFVKMLKTTRAAVHRHDVAMSHLSCNALFETHHACSFETKLVAAIDGILVAHSKSEPVSSKDIAAYMDAHSNDEITWTTEGKDREHLRRLGVIPRC